MAARSRTATCTSTTTARLKGGWNVGASYFVETFGYDSTIYRGVYVQQANGDVTPFTGGGQRLPNHDYVLQFNTPAWKHFDFSGFTLIGLNDENYAEWSSGRLVHDEPRDEHPAQ